METLLESVQQGHQVDRERAHLQAIREQQITRERIRRSLHSSVLNTISTLHLSLSLASQLEGVSEEERSMFTSHKELTYGLIQEVREAMWLLNYEEDQLSDLIQAMEIALEKATLLHRTSFDATAVLEDTILSPLQKLNIFLIFREAVQNGVKHAKASCITVDVSFANGVLSLAVRDDGKGFVFGVSKTRGIDIMVSQAKEIGGELDVVSIDGQGTTITLRVALS